jgi:hypothetical protein
VLADAIALLAADGHPDALRLLEHSRLTLHLEDAYSWPGGDYYPCSACLWVAGNGHVVLNDGKHPTGQAIWSAIGMAVERILPTAYLSGRQVWSEQELRLIKKYWIDSNLPWPAT